MELKPSGEASSSLLGQELNRKRAAVVCGVWSLCVRKKVPKICRGVFLSHCVNVQLVACRKILLIRVLRLNCR